MEGNPGMYVAIEGEDFDPSNVAVDFDGIPAKATVLDSKRMDVMVPSGAKDGRISVTTAGHRVTFPFDFRVTTSPPPSKHTITIHPAGRVCSILLSHTEFEAMNASQDLQSNNIVQDLYTKFEDEFDFIFLVHNNEYTPPGKPVAFAVPVSNNIKGIGQQIFDNTSVWGSSGRLKASLSFMYFTESMISGGLGLHEVMHTWANWMLEAEHWDSQLWKPIPAQAHWGFAGCGNVLGGFIQSSLRDSVDGNPNKYSFTLPPGNTFSDFELYVMGLLPPTAIQPFDVFTQATHYDLSGLIANSRKTYDRFRIEAEFGVRTPDYLSSQKEFRALVVAVTSLPLTKEQWDIIDRDAQTFFHDGSDDNEAYNFWEATRGLAVMRADSLHTFLRQ